MLHYFGSEVKLSGGSTPSHGRVGYAFDSLSWSTRKGGDMPMVLPLGLPKTGVELLSQITTRTA